jgi:hypothetical protein
LVDKRGADASNADDSREQLFAALYDELRKMAYRELQRGIAVTLNPTTLLHEPFLNVCRRQTVPFEDTRHFIRYACRVMRGLMLGRYLLVWNHTSIDRVHILSGALQRC